MLRKSKHLRFTRTRIRELRYQMVNHCLSSKDVDTQLLKHYAGLIKKYQRKYTWIKM
jgi:hypothetical protein